MAVLAVFVSMLLTMWLKRELGLSWLVWLAWIPMATGALVAAFSRWSSAVDLVQRMRACETHLADLHAAVRRRETRERSIVLTGAN